MSFPYINAYQQFFDSSGAPLASGTVEFRDPTSNALIDTYPTADDADAQTNANANPLTLNASGAAPTGLFLEDGVKYKVIVKDVNGATIATHDDVLCPIGLPYLQTAAESAAGVTPVNIEYPPGDVRRYGAVGDGVADDTSAIQDGLDVGAQNGDITYLPAGTYLVSSALNLVTENTVLGDGELRTRLLCNSATADVLKSTTTESLITIQGLQISFSVTRTAGSAIVFTGVSQFIIRDVRILAPWNGITLTTCTAGHTEHVRITTGTGGWNRGVYLQDCTSSDFFHVDCVYGNFTPAAHCFEIQSDCDTIQFYYCQGTSAGGTGNCIPWSFKDTFSTVPPRWIKLFGCTSEGGNSASPAAAKDGFQIVSGTSIEFIGCFAASSRHGLSVTGGNGIRWIGGEILGNARHGVSITGGLGVQVKFADIHNNSKETATTYDGINVNAAITQFDLVGNHIGTRDNFSTTSAHRYDIAIENVAANRFIVTNNILFNGDSGYLLDSSTGTQKIIKDNLLGSNNIISFTDADATPDISVGDFFQCANTGATTITDFDGAYSGKEITVRIDVNTTIQNNANIATSTGSDLTGSANNSYRFVNYGGKWIQS